MKCVVDANVLLPLLLEQHPHRPAAAAWWDQQADESVLFTLPVRMALLRLLTNRTLMGKGVLQPEEAWAAVAVLTGDARAEIRTEVPPGLDSFWHHFVRGRAPAPNLWTDAWLAAFAEAEGAEMVTFDREFGNFPLSHLRLLVQSE